MNENIEINDSAISKIGALAIAAQVAQSVSGTQHLIIPEGYTHKDITEAVEKAQDNPNRKRSTIALADLPSFILFAQEQALQERGYIYADPDARTLTAVLNDHRDKASPGWRDFRVTYKAELSREFSGWMKNDKQPMEQEAFAIFLEDNIEDVVEPSGDTLLSIALTLQAKTQVDFSSSKRLDNGQVQLAYTETVDARAGTGAIEIPREFKIGCRLFKNGDGYKIKARLKYRLGQGKVKFWYELDRPENAIEAAFSKYVEQARESGYVVLIGKP